MYPIQRNRRLRSSESIRSLVRENRLTPNDFIVPLFVVEGKNLKESIPSMPGYSRMSLDLLSGEVKSLWQLGLKTILEKLADCLFFLQFYYKNKSFLHIFRTKTYYRN